MTQFPSLRPSLLFLTLALLNFMPCAARGSHNYYVDPAQGNDAHSGRSPQMAWRTLQRAAQAPLQAGDSLLLRRGTTFRGERLEISAEGREGRPVVVGAYGTGRKPRIEAPDSSLYAVAIRNSSFLTLRDLDVCNTGSARLARRTGVKVECRDYGTSRDIRLACLYVHDVNGSLIKEQGGGSGILIENGGHDVVSTFDGLTIEDCVVRRCERNAMIWNCDYWSRQRWHPSRHVVVRRNLIEEVPGDGIVPIGCVGALVEYNLMRHCPGTLPHSEAAAGIWPWSCDSTVVIHNEVSDHKAPWDAQGFDADYNCVGTRIAYNYSHDNDGGFVLICCDGNDRGGVGNRGTVVEGNVSVNDGIRPRATRSGIFSPSIHIAGPCRGAVIRRNIVHVCPKPETFIDRCIIASDTWAGYADSTVFQSNLFYVAEPSEVRLTQSTRNQFDGNIFLGTVRGLPSSDNNRRDSEFYSRIAASDPSGRSGLDFLFDSVVVGDGAAILHAVNDEATKLSEE